MAKKEHVEFRLKNPIICMKISLIRKKHVNHILNKNWKLIGRHLPQKRAQMETIQRRDWRSPGTHIVFKFF